MGKLTSIIKISLKKHAETRWCSKTNAVNAVYGQYESIISVLRNMKDNYTVSDTYSIASALHFQMYDFVTFLNLWNHVLEKINRINIALQRKDQDIYRASILIRGLINSLKDFRNSKFLKNFRF